MSTIDPNSIDLICYDFDGVMTDNRVFVFQDGREAVAVNRADGLAIAAIRRRGIPQIILSTETNPVVAARADKLGIPAIHGVDDKAIVLTDFAARNDHSLQRTVYIGNDLNDLSAMRLVRYPVAPQDGHLKICDIAVLVTNACGGHGVVREFYETVFGLDGLEGR